MHTITINEKEAKGLHGRFGESKGKIGIMCF